ncbi:hypothetical protein BJY52DRAFT_5300 [Lactarius psammicola]|nr:hypothetical protein BJY52DRAFT_5300 [Lactarius psammicola]
MTSSLVTHSAERLRINTLSLFMRLNLPAGTTVRGVTFRMLCVGNPAWATYFDSQIANFTRLNNKCDVVPTVPGRRLRFPALTRRNPHSGGRKRRCFPRDESDIQTKLALSLPCRLIAPGVHLVVDQLMPVTFMYTSMRATYCTSRCIMVIVLPRSQCLL